MNDPTRDAAATSSPVGVAFADFELRRAPLELRRNGRGVALQHQALKLLDLLASRPGALVTLDDVRARLWPGRTVDFARSVHVHVRRLRAALGDDAAAPRFIETAPRQGYRFIASVRMIERPIVTARAPHRRLVAVAAGAAAVIAAAVFVASGPAPRVDPAARDAAARGRHLLGQVEPDAARAALERFEEALAVAPEFVDAHVGAGEATAMLGDFPAAQAHADAALALDPRSAAAHALLGRIALTRDWNWEEGRAELERARALDPDLLQAHMGLAVYHLARGEDAAALAAMRRARELDPVSALVAGDFGWFQLVAGNYERAEALCAEALTLAPAAFDFAYCVVRARAARDDHVGAQIAILAALAAAGVDGDVVDRVHAAAPGDAVGVFEAWRLERYESPERAAPVDPVTLALARARLGDADGAIAAFEKAVDEHAPFAPLVLRDPAFRAFSDDPRLADLRARLDLA